MKNKNFISVFLFGFFVGTYGLYGCSRNEQQCTRDKECCTNCCFEGVCLTEVACNPCLTTECSLGRVCVPKQVQCIRAPCPPVPRCIDPDLAAGSEGLPLPLPQGSLNPCSYVRCGYGTVCVPKTLRCSSPPCRLQPQCVFPKNPLIENPSVIPQDNNTPTISQQVAQQVVT